MDGPDVGSTDIPPQSGGPTAADPVDDDGQDNRPEWVKRGVGAKDPTEYGGKDDTSIS